MSSLYHPRPVLSTQRYSTSGTEYIDNRRGSYHHAAPSHQQLPHSLSANRMPLRESTGNQQPYMSSASSSSCYQQTHPGSLPSPSIPQPYNQMVVPSQSFESLYRMPESRHYGGGLHGRRGYSEHKNPLYSVKAFREYRSRQTHKDNQKEKVGVWSRIEVEDAFVDAILLMPHMGRRKFSMKGALHGRNMLISEYIYSAIIHIFGSDEILREGDEDGDTKKGRKKISSHMQVLKKFFDELRCFHFLFSSDPREKKEGCRFANWDDDYEDEEQESFKSNPVLAALSKDRMPDVKPNYEYFAKLIQLTDRITVQPKTFEFIVASGETHTRDGIVYDSHNRPLDHKDFPHLGRYWRRGDEKDKNVHPPSTLRNDELLHEYARSMDRTSSACAKAITRRWSKIAPELYESLDLPKRDEECVLIEMCSVIEVLDHHNFPEGTELHGFMEFSVPMQKLQQQRWKCVTRLTRPEGLYSDGASTEMYVNETHIHRKDCADPTSPDCRCHHASRSEIAVPFPAVEWADILTMANQYPDVEHQAMRENKRKGRGEAKPEEAAKTGSKRKRSKVEAGDASAWQKRENTGSDLIRKVAMYQELLSCAPGSNRWERQAIIFWRFNTTNQWYDYNPVSRPAGTTWRWLTVNDPMSRQHQQNALVVPHVGVGRDAVMSPTPTIGQHLTANMNETFHSWDHAAAGAPALQMSSLGSTTTTGINTNLFEFSNGLATPPPTAGLHSSYPHGSFDASASISSASGTGAPSYLSTVTGASSVTQDHHIGSSSSTQGQQHQHQQQQQQQQQPPQPHGVGMPTAPGYFGSPSYTDAKPAMVQPYIPSSSSALDLNTNLPLAYDSSSTTTLQNWEISALDSYTSPTNGTPSSSAAAAGQGPQNWGPPPPSSSSSHHQQPHHHQAMMSNKNSGVHVPGGPPMWPGQWSQMGGAAGANTSAERDISPRAGKKRRVEYDGAGYYS